MIRLENVNKSLGDFKLKNVNISLKDGEYFVILGPTGTGKTVILETIAGMYVPDSGSIYFNDTLINNVLPEDRSVGFVYQDYGLFPHLSAKENIVYGLNSRKFSKEYRLSFLESISKTLKISHLLEKDISTLSGGEKQRIAFARAIAIKPNILLLDEPMSALDPNTKEELMYELKEIHKNLGTTSIHVTHDFREALYLADRIGVLFSGEFIQIGTPEEIFFKPSSLKVSNFIGLENIFPCDIKDNIAYLSNDLSLQINYSKSINCHITVFPNDISISKNIIENRDNVFKGYIKEIIANPFYLKVYVDIGIDICIVCLNDNYNNLNFCRNDEVWVGFDKSAINILT
ncbi:molybdate ABC transporter ATP-binding protein ModC [Gottschalkia acidurici 9a]|uniref:Molybdate ABC transporter ATP-binding protein ModC n=1 Tax=Gottschalkia acidurici (strain ATCC 7906 / DSM 604 / BCRC 14475 / CIP 104303 / KCTC 5404 / NCIMB 10678 / 9a) TaxID=1128398 RepID=K0AVZ5_GOTA9|nr:ATP-binding cassette domain-containing protein [Gottschalkia acidurici]AFS78063.1 molybdate ABC transporter ATP-binding protein ModC [Gottschalkia acidurici 9a]